MVNGLDLGIWRVNFGVGAAWQLGDANYDGVVNGLDLDLLQKYFGKTAITDDVIDDSGAAGRIAMPEPGTPVLLAAGLLGLLASFWRRRRQFTNISRTAGLRDIVF